MDSATWSLREKVRGKAWAWYALWMEACRNGDYRLAVVWGARYEAAIVVARALEEES